VLLMGSLFGLFPFLLKLYADSGYQGPKFQTGLNRACRQINLEIVKPSELHKFVVLPKRWIVERTISRLNRCRRLAKDWECLNQNALAFSRWASIHIMLRKLCQNAG
jgi:transposase